jgi:LPS-assembly protein
VIPFERLQRARMLNLIRSVSLLTCICLAAPAVAQQIRLPPAQPPAPAAQPAAPSKPVTETTVSDSREGSNNQKDWHFIGHVEMDRAGDTKIYADDVMAYTGENRAIATGNVVMAQGENRISAERAEFDTETRLGTFYNAWGLSTVKPPKPQAARPGAIAPPPVVGQETVVIFFGEKIEKIGPKKYRITNGGFYTCVQPTPRWDLHAGTVILNIDHYTVLTNAVLRVKGVPMFYTPILYYPTKREDRATGLLIPTYGASSLRGQSIHNAFFWAIDRSQDATVMYDWFSKTGQGVGSEYRYNLGNGDGNIRAYLDDQHAATYTDNSGNTTTTEATRSYQVNGSANQLLPGNIRARANVQYFSSIAESQTFNTNIFDASRNSRTFGGNLVGAWDKYSLNVTMNHSEYFTDVNTSYLAGDWPRISFTRNERPILDSPAYFSVTTEFVNTLNSSKSTTTDATIGSTTTTTDTGLSRIDFAPQIRYPFKKWQWFTVNSTVSWRETYYSRSYEPTGDPNVLPTKVLDVGLNRTLYTIQAQITGPVFNKVWDTPDNGYAEKFKHSIEPVLTVNRTSSVDNIDRIVKLDGIDNFVGGATFTYGLNNRFYAKRKLTPGGQAQSREIFDVELSQSYYTNVGAAQYDLQYQTAQVPAAQGQVVPTHFSPIALSFRAIPADAINATLRAEFDARYHRLRTISAQGMYSWTNRIQISGTWTKRGYIAQVPEFNDCRVPPTDGTTCLPALLDQAIGITSTMHTKDNRVGSNVSFNYDILQHYMQQQQVSLFYNAQCCGIALQFQTYNYGINSVSPIPADHRFFLSFTLAGLGNFSPFNGALSGVPR